MVYLAAQPEDQPVPLSEIVAREGIPAAFLERIMARLREGGLVSTARGVSGGYYLAQPPYAISVSDVVVALEGPLSLVGCLADESCCDRAGGCVSQRVWQRLDDAITGALTAITLRDLTMEAVTT